MNSSLSPAMRVTLHHNGASHAWQLDDGLYLHRMFGHRFIHIFVDPKKWKRTRTNGIRKIKGVCPTGKTSVYTMHSDKKRLTVKEIQERSHKAFMPSTEGPHFAPDPKRIWVGKIHKH